MSLKWFHGFLLSMLLPVMVQGQGILTGKVFGINNEEKKEPLPFSTIFWKGTSLAVNADEKGIFRIQKLNGDHFLICSFVGYQADTIYIYDVTDSIEIVLRTNKVLNEVVIEERLGGNYISGLQTHKTEIITNDGLQRLACCNLSESFENTATVDVGYADAVSGAKRIQMLGLSGIYSQLMLENIPMMRGLASAYGLTFIPGSWMESIQVSKGTSSVINGYESITGQINIEYKKPVRAEKFFINIYGNDELKMEGNLYSAIKINKSLSTMIMAHVDYSGLKLDHNHDGFMDMPLGKQYNVVNRWQLEKKNMHGIYLISVLKDNRRGGQMDFNHKAEEGTQASYGLEVNTDRYQFFSKTGFGFNGNPNQSLGIQTSFTYHHQNSFYGMRKYDGVQFSSYLNAIYETSVFNSFHKVSTGISYMFDHYGETLDDINFVRTEHVPGAFGQYSYNYPDKFNLILGFRADYNSKYGVFLTPRIHFKWNITGTLTVRGSAGKGYRTASVLAENAGVLASSRQIVFSSKFDPEQAWNYGVNLTREFALPKKRKATFSIDIYRTDFVNQIIADLDANPQQARFYNLDGKSWSNSFQAEFNVEVIRHLDITAAFRYNDVKTTINGRLTDKPFVNRYKGLLSISYATKYEKWKFDITSQLNGDCRLPDTQDNPQVYRAKERSPVYFLMHAQITKKFRWLDIYAGCENITDYKQNNPVIAANDPFGKYFDSSLIWGPIVGRMFYGGLRITLK